MVDQLLTSLQSPALPCNLPWFRRKQRFGDVPSEQRQEERERAAAGGDGARKEQQRWACRELGEGWQEKMPEFCSRGSVAAGKTCGADLPKHRDAGTMSTLVAEHSSADVATWPRMVQAGLSLRWLQQHRAGWVCTALSLGSSLCIPACSWQCSAGPFLPASTAPFYFSAALVAAGDSSIHLPGSSAPGGHIWSPLRSPQPFLALVGKQRRRSLPSRVCCVCLECHSQREKG